MEQVLTAPTYVDYDQLPASPASPPILLTPEELLDEEPTPATPAPDASNPATPVNGLGHGVGVR